MKGSAKLVKITIGIKNTRMEYSKSMNTIKPLYEFLMGLRKVDMQDIAELFNEKLPDSWQKEHMARRLADIYKQNTRGLASMFSPPVITYLQNFFSKKLNGILSSHDDFDQSYGDLAQVYDQLEFLGLVDYINGKIIIPEFLEEVVSKINLPSVAQLEELQDMELCALGIMDIYGLVEEPLFLSLLCECYPQCSRDQAYDFLTHRLEIRIMSYCVDFADDLWWFSDLIDNPEEWYSVIQKRKNIPYQSFTKDEFIDFAIYAFSKPPQNYDRLISLLRKDGMGQAEAESTLEEEIMNHRCHLNSDLDIPGFIQEIMGRENERESKQVLDLYIEFVNNIPIWFNKGFAPAELFQRSLPPRVKTLPGAFWPTMGSSGPFVKQNVNNVIPFPTVKTGKRKVGRNEPCPCGSGKKYKDCCGKDKQDE